MTELNIIGDLFCADIDAVFDMYLKGYYSNAVIVCKERLEDHGVQLDDWQRQILQALHIYLSTWDQDRACGKIHSLFNAMTEAGDERSSWIAFYKLLFCTWLCSRERSNLSLLQRARMSADQAAHILTKIGQIRAKELSAPLEAYNFFPRPWCIFWFRGVVRHSLGVPDAITDFRRSHTAIQQATRQHFDINDDQEITIVQLQTYCRQKAKVAARFYNDLGIILFEMGDMRSARRALQLAAGKFPEDGQMQQGIDPDNPYIWSNLGFILYSLKMEGAALAPLLRAYQIIEPQIKQNITGFYVSGRIFYFLGVFAYRWVYKSIDPYDQDQETLLGNKIHNLDMEYMSFFESISRAFWLLEMAFKQYLAVKDLARALPALLVCYDPLSSEDSPSQIAKASRRLLWELCYGMADFVSTQLNYERMIDTYLLPDIVQTEKEADNA